MSAEITKEQIESEKADATQVIEYYLDNDSKSYAVESKLFPPLFHYRNGAGEIVLGIVPDDRPAMLVDKLPAEAGKDPVAFVYYFCDGGNFEVRTWTADELPADEDEWDWFIENELQSYYGRSEGIRYIWSYNEVPEIPEKPVIATGPKPMPSFMHESE